MEKKKKKSSTLIKVIRKNKNLRERERERERENSKILGRKYGLNGRDDIEFRTKKKNIRRRRVKI